MQVRIKRIYEPAASDDGIRVLVDRLWPRGVRKDEGRYDLWLKDVAPSPALRTWYGHDPDRFEDFARRYRAELEDEAHAAALARLRELVSLGRVTLLTATKDPSISAAQVLAEVLGA